MFSRYSGTLFLLWLGFSALVSQTLFVRELLNLFSGNEFSLGITLAAWLLFTSLGAACGDSLARCRHLVTVTVFAVILLSVLLPLFPIAAMAYRPLAGIPPELCLTPGQMVVASMLLQFFPAFLFGLLFPLGYLFYSSSNKTRGGDAGRAYALESTGCLIGGLAALLLILPQQSPIPALIFSSLSGLIITLFCLLSFPLKWRLRAVLATMLLIPVIGLPVAVGSGALEFIEKAATTESYPYAKVLYSAVSRYQRLTLLSMEGQFTMLAGGAPVLSIPHPDDGSSEATIMIPIMATGHVESVLVIGGLDTLPRQASLLPGVRRIDCLVGDPAMFDTIELIPNAKRQLGLNDSRIHQIRVDARRFSAETVERYDVVLISMPAPVTLTGNRFYTAEFFRQIAVLLNNNGMLAVALPGSDTYLSSTSAGMLASIKRAMGTAFQFTLAIPGENTLLLASRLPIENRLDAGVLTNRLSLSGITPQFMTRDYLDDRLSRKRLDWLQSKLEQSGTLVNRDNFPAATAMALATRMEQQGNRGRWWAWFLQRWVIIPFAALLLILTALPGTALCGNRKLTWLGAMASTGFVAMALQVLLMLAYQSRTGMIYQAVALFTTLFMSGSALGVLLSARLERAKPPGSVSLLAEAGFAVLAVSLLLLFFYGDSETFNILLPVGGILAGLLTGMEFQSITKVLGLEEAFGERPGSVYAADLIGGSLGGALTGMLIIPSAGFAVTCAILAAVKMVQLFTLSRLREIRG